MTFSCTGCAAAPRLQEVYGCFTEVEKPIARLGDHLFHRCPRTFVGARELYVLGLSRDGFLKSLGPMGVRRQPTKLVEAVLYVASLTRREAARDD